jgi:hypothetical protein
MTHASQDSRHFDVTGIADRLSAGVTCFPAQCSAAVNQRETVASGQTREKSRIEFPIAYLRCRNTKADTCRQSARVVPAPKVQIIAPVISSCRARERLFLPALG